MNLTKKQLTVIGIGVFLCAAIAVIAMLFFPSGKSNVIEVGDITLYEPIGGWRQAENKKENFTLLIPQDWAIDGNTENYALKAAIQEEEGDSEATASVHVFENTSQLSPEEWVGQNPDYVYTDKSSYRPFKEKNISGARYTGPIGYGEGIFDQESHTIFHVIENGEKIFIVMCLSGGESYQILIPECEQILETFSFTESSL